MRRRPRPRTTVKRPRIFRLLFWLMFGQAAMFLAYFGLYALYGLPLLEVIVPEVQLGTFRFAQEITVYLLLTSTWLVLGFSSVIIGVGLRRGTLWSWTAAIILQGAILLLSLEAYFTHNADTMFYLAMLVAVAVVLTLNQREVLVFYRADRATLLE